MTKRIIKPLLTVLLMVSVCGLDAHPLRNHTKGAITLNAGYFMSDHSYGGTFGDTYWFNERISLDTRLNISSGTKEFTEYLRYAIDNQICYNFCNLADRFYIDGVIGVQVGIDDMKSKVEDIEEKSYMYLGSLGCKCKLFINYKWTFWLEAKERAGISKIDKYVPQFTIGTSLLLPEFGHKNNRKFQ